MIAGANMFTGSQKRVSDPLELESQAVVGHHMGAGDPTQALMLALY